jgi:hypothetical protein
MTTENGSCGGAGMEKPSRLMFAGKVKAVAGSHNESSDMMVSMFSILRSELLNSIGGFIRISY